VTYQGAACDAASMYFGPTIRATDMLVLGRVVHIVPDVVSETMPDSRCQNGPLIGSGIVSECKLHSCNSEKLSM